MAQGRLKVKNKGAVPNKPNKQRKANPKKGGFGLKKGGRYIAPKKEKLKQAERVKKGLEMAIKNNIEQELKEVASKEGKPFKVVDAPKKEINTKKKGKR